MPDSGESQNETSAHRQWRKFLKTQVLRLKATFSSYLYANHGAIFIRELNIFCKMGRIGLCFLADYKNEKEKDKPGEADKQKNFFLGWN